MLKAKVTTPDFRAAFSDYYRFHGARLEAAMLNATHKAGNRLKAKIREEFSGAALGRLGQAFTSKSDLDRGGVQKRYGSRGFSVSSTVYVRSKSERSLGAIEAYTQGADIRPVRSRWLWIPTDDIQRVAGPKKAKMRVTPGNWRRLGLEARIGPLVQIKASNGNPLLVVRNVGLALSGKSRSARALTKRGRPRKGQALQEFIVAFIGIPFTSRAARVDIEALVLQIHNELPNMISQELGRI